MGFSFLAYRHFIKNRFHDLSTEQYFSMFHEHSVSCSIDYSDKPSEMGVESVTREKEEVLDSSMLHLLCM